MLGTQDFWRLRIGIGHPRDSSRAQRKSSTTCCNRRAPRSASAIDDALDKALEIWPLIAAHDMEAAMLKLHTKTT